jgi:hypothetical protein
MKNNVRYSYGYNGTVPCGRLCRGEVNTDGVTKSDILEKIQVMRQEILTGRGQGTKLKLNNSWDDADAGKYFDEIEQMTDLYSSL